MAEEDPGEKLSLIRLSPGKCSVALRQAASRPENAGADQHKGEQDDDVIRQNVSIRISMAPLDAKLGKGASWNVRSVNALF